MKVSELMNRGVTPIGQARRRMKSLGRALARRHSRPDNFPSVFAQEMLAGSKYRRAISRNGQNVMKSILRRRADRVSRPANLVDISSARQDARGQEFSHYRLPEADYIVLGFSRDLGLNAMRAADRLRGELRLGVIVLDGLSAIPYRRLAHVMSDVLAVTVVEPANEAGLQEAFSLLLRRALRAESERPDWPWPTGNIPRIYTALRVKDGCRIRVEDVEAAARAMKYYGPDIIWIGEEESESGAGITTPPPIDVA